MPFHGTLVYHPEDFVCSSIFLSRQALHIGFKSEFDITLVITHESAV
jgi:hypothetical protein